MMTAREFKLGQLTFTYENGFIRYVRSGGAELIRMMYFALRDQQWRTIPFTISDENIEYTDGQSLRISYRAINHLNGNDILQWNVDILATPEEVRFGVDGVVVNSFIRNRVGICVLHPLDETLGRTATIYHPDGGNSTTEFPVRIKPHQPFKEIKEMSWQLDNGVAARLSFEGDIFETEDQRNWSDASFKTYSTPLRIPFPVEIRNGDRVSQSVTLRISHSHESLPSVQSNDPIRIEIQQGATTPFPQLGTLFNHQMPLPAAGLEALHELSLSHLRIDVHANDSLWRTVLRDGMAMARLSGLSPVLALHFFGDFIQEWQTLHGELESAKDILKTVWLFGEEHFVSNNNLLHTLAPDLRKIFTDITIVGGSASHFVELNRYPFNFDLVDAVGYAVTPQAHANDDRTIVENLAAMPHAVRSARSLSGDKPVFVSPLTLRGQHAEADSRQGSMFAAGWTIAAIKYLGEEGVSAVTIFELFGAKGLMDNNGGFPVFEALRRINHFKPELIMRSRSSDPLRVNSLVLVRGTGRLTIIVNHTPDPVSCVVDGNTHLLAGYAIIYMES